MSLDVISSHRAGIPGDRGADLPEDGEPAHSGTMHLGLVPFVSHWLGAYGQLLLVVYVRWQTGLLVASDWLRPVMRGGWRATPPITAEGLADVS